MLGGVILSIAYLMLVMLGIIMLGVSMLIIIMLGAIMLCVIILGVIMLIVIMMGAIMLGASMLSAIMLGVIMLSVEGSHLVDPLELSGGHVLVVGDVEDLVLPRGPEPSVAGVLQFGVTQGVSS
jgi:hypothetical protein